MALLDSRSLHNPLVARVDELGQIGIAKRLRRQIGAHAKNDGT
jgi:hypothetical protein